jgi:hypothetical protein
VDNLAWFAHATDLNCLSQSIYDDLSFIYNSTTVVRRLLGALLGWGKAPAITAMVGPRVVSY